LMLIPLAACLAGGAALSAQPADRVPPFSVRLLDDDRVLTDADLHGGFTLVSFWSTTCRVCVAELPNLEAAHARFGDRVRILSLSMDRDEAAVHAFRRDRHPMPWPHAFVGSEGEVVESFGVRGTPHLLLVGPDGRIVARSRELIREQLLETLARVTN
jgi:peroxiredoxin